MLRFLSSFGSPLAERNADSLCSLSLAKALSSDRSCWIVGVRGRRRKDSSELSFLSFSPSVFQSLLGADACWRQQDSTVLSLIVSVMAKAALTLRSFRRCVRAGIWESGLLDSVVYCCTALEQSKTQERLTLSPWASLSSSLNCD